MRYDEMIRLILNDDQMEPSRKLSILEGTFKLDLDTIIRFALEEGKEEELGVCVCQP